MHATRNRARVSLGLLALEPRMMFDGAAVVDAAHAAASAEAKALIPNVPVPVTIRAADPAQDGGKKEVAFVDTSANDYQTLEAGIRAGVEIVEIDGGQSGLAQMAKWAETHTGFDAIHVLSHGSEGVLHLGTDRVNDDSLSSTMVQAELAEIGHALKAGGDLLLYGCDVGKLADGQLFVADLAVATGADVAASDNLTGNASVGGDWVLERQTGTIDVSGIDEAESYDGLLTLAVNKTTFSSIEMKIYAQGAGASSEETVSCADIASSGWNISITSPTANTSSPSIRGITSQTPGTEDNKYVYIQGGRAVIKIIPSQTFTFDYTNMVIRTAGAGTLRVSALDASGAETGAVVDNVVTAATNFFTSATASGAGFNDIYGIQVTFVDWTSSGNPDTRNLFLDTINVTDIKTPAAPPSFTSASAVNFAENLTSTAYTAAATSGSGAVTYSLIGIVSLSN